MMNMKMNALTLFTLLLYNGYAFAQTAVCYQAPELMNNNFIIKIATKLTEKGLYVEAISKDGKKRLAQEHLDLAMHGGGPQITSCWVTRHNNTRDQISNGELGMRLTFSTPVDIDRSTCKLANILPYLKKLNSFHVVFYEANDFNSRSSVYLSNVKLVRCPR